MFGKRGKIAQTTLEYAIILTLVVGAVAAMQLYVKRGINSRIKDVVDHTGAGGDVGGSDFQWTSGGQYEPYYLSSTANTNQNAQSSENMAEGGATNRASTSTTTATQQQTMGWDQ